MGASGRLRRLNAHRLVVDCRLDDYVITATLQPEMQMLRMYIARLLAAVMLIAAVANVVLVECRAAGHHAVELAGHAAQMAPCANASACCEATHRHDECSDQALLDPVTLQRIDQNQLTSTADAAVVVVLPPTMAWNQTALVDHRRRPQLCPRPPPDLPAAADAFVALRLLI